MNSFCWFCAPSDWEGITCKCCRFPLLHHCAPESLCVQSILLSEDTALALILYFKRGTEALIYNYLCKTTWEICGEAEIWNQIAKSSLSTGHSIGFLLVILSISYQLPSGFGDMCNFISLFCKTLKFLQWSGLTPMSFTKICNLGQSRRKPTD